MLFYLFWVSFKSSWSASTLLAIIEGNIDDLRFLAYFLGGTKKEEFEDSDWIWLDIK